MVQIVAMYITTRSAFVLEIGLRMSRRTTSQYFKLNTYIQRETCNHRARLKSPEYVLIVGMGKSITQGINYIHHLRGSTAVMVWMTQSNLGLWAQQRTMESLQTPITRPLGFYLEGYGRQSNVDPFSDGVLDTQKRRKTLHM